jgi:hypothetical protein
LGHIGGSSHGLGQRRLLQQSDPVLALEALMDKPLAAEMQAIASAPGGDGFLDDQQLTRLFDQYLAAFEAAGITRQQLDCAKANPYSL